MRLNTRGRVPQFLLQHGKMTSASNTAVRVVRALILYLILFSETGSSPAAGRPAKITNPFAGRRAGGLLGFTWFDANVVRVWRLSGPETGSSKVGFVRPRSASGIAAGPGLAAQSTPATPTTVATNPPLPRPSASEAKRMGRGIRPLMRGAHKAGRLGWEGCGP